MKPHNPRRQKFTSLTDQERVILANALCEVIDKLLDLLIAVDPAPHYGVPFIGWELPAARRSRRVRQVDDNLDQIRCIPVRPASSSGRNSASQPNDPGLPLPLAYPLRLVWDKKIRTNLN